jgi:hypothetical protein
MSNLTPYVVVVEFVCDKLILQEVAYQTLVNGLVASLTRDNKLTWIPMPFWLGSYFFRGIKKMWVAYIREKDKEQS